MSIQIFFESKTNFCPKNIGYKNDVAQKSLCEKMFYPTNFCTNKLFGPKNIWVKKVKFFGNRQIFVKKKSWSTKIKATKILVPKSMVKIVSVTAEILIKKIGSQKFGQNRVINS